MESETPRSHFKPRVERFISEYLRDFNGTRAAVRAGYSPRSARYQASKLLRNVAVSNEITQRFERELSNNHASSTRIFRELSLIALLDPAKMLDENGRLLPLDQLPLELRHGIPAMTVIQSRSESDPKDVRVVQKFHFDKISALTLLLRHFGMLTRRNTPNPEVLV
jgi:phage terminase small subunit